MRVHPSQVEKVLPITIGSVNDAPEVLAPPYSLIHFGDFGVSSYGMASRILLSASEESERTPTHSPPHRLIVNQGMAGMNSTLQVNHSHRQYVALIFTP